MKHPVALFENETEAVRTLTAEHPRIAKLRPEYLDVLLRVWMGTRSPVYFAGGKVIGPLGDNAPLIVSYGAGTDSTAVLVALHREGIRPDAILFADVGDEMPHTYAYLPVINAWLESVGFPQVTIVEYRPKRFKYHIYNSLSGNCLANRTLPGISFGRGHSCSVKWKGSVLDGWVTTNIGKGGCYRAIGYDCSPKDNKRFKHAQGKKQFRPQDVFIYPLHVWGWTRDDCDQAIAEAGLPSPGKSSCYFCASMKPEELLALRDETLLLWQIVILEANAQPNLKTVKGFWRSKRMTDFIREKGMLSAEGIAEAWEKWSAPERIITDPSVEAEDYLVDEALFFAAKYPGATSTLVFNSGAFAPGEGVKGAA